MGLCGVFTQNAPDEKSGVLAAFEFVNREMEKRRFYSLPKAKSLAQAPHMLSLKDKQLRFDHKIRKPSMHHKKQNPDPLHFGRRLQTR
jgi:hypothetical protein